MCIWKLRVASRLWTAMAARGQLEIVPNNRGTTLDPVHSYLSAGWIAPFAGSASLRFYRIPRWNVFLDVEGTSPSRSGKINPCIRYYRAFVHRSLSRRRHHLLRFFVVLLSRVSLREITFVARWISDTMVVSFERNFD